MLRLIAFLALGAGLARGCDCISPNVRNARKNADIVFRGRVTGFRESELGRVVVFAVDRVWKGDVAQTFEMPAFIETTACIGFWPTFLEVGKYLLVYARKQGRPQDYFTDICSRTALADESKDFAQLGRGRNPNSK